MQAEECTQRPNGRASLYATLTEVHTFRKGSSQGVTNGVSCSGAQGQGGPGIGSSLHDVLGGWPLKLDFFSRAWSKLSTALHPYTGLGWHQKVWERPALYQEDE